jgi:hypothetical protein
MKLKAVNPLENLYQVLDKKGKVLLEDTILTCCSYIKENE